MRKASESPARAAAWALLISGLALIWATSITWLGPGGQQITSINARAWTALSVGLVGGFGSALLGFYLLQAALSTARLRLKAPGGRRPAAPRHTEGEPSNDWADEQIT